MRLDSIIRAATTPFSRPNMFSFLSRPFAGGSIPLSRPSAGGGIPLPPVPAVHVETDHSKPVRTLKHLLKLNHAEHAILFHDRQFHNHLPHILGSAYLLGGTSKHLEDVYAEESKMLVRWEDSPGEISEHDWRDYLGQRDYERAYIDFFEDQVAEHGYDWKAVVRKFLFEGERPLANGVVGSGLAHPIIHLAYGYELGSRDVAIEGLGLLATNYNFLHKYLDDPAYTPAAAAADNKHPQTPLEILRLVRDDARLKDAPVGSGGLAELFERFEDVVLEYWNMWALPEPVKQFEDSQHAAAGLLMATQTPAQPGDYDFFLCHLLTSSHAVRIFLPAAPAAWHVALVRQWWLFTLAVYIVQERKDVDLSTVEKYELKGRDWKWADKQALESKWCYDAHYVKAIRALKNAAETWGDPESFKLKAAVKFIDNFEGWGGFHG